MQNSPMGVLKFPAYRSRFDPDAAEQGTAKPAHTLEPTWLGIWQDLIIKIAEKDP